MKDIPSGIMVPCRVSVGDDSVVANFIHDGLVLRNYETIEIPITQTGEHRSLTVMFLLKKCDAELTRITHVRKGDTVILSPNEIVIRFY